MITTVTVVTIFIIVVKLSLVYFVNLHVVSSKHMEKTFQLQDKLLSLPVPPLAQTCEKYLDSGTDMSNQ